MNTQSQTIYPSAIFSDDEKYLQFINNLLSQTNEASNNNRMAFFIPANAMLQKKYFHDFLLETKRRFLINQSKESGSASSLSDSSS